MSLKPEGLLISRTLRLFLDSIGRREEYEFYLKKFQADHAVTFALVVPDDASVDASGDLMTFDLQFLLRLDLCPVLLLCGDAAESNLGKLQAHGDYIRLDVGLEDADAAWRKELQAALNSEKVPVLCMQGVESGDAVASVVPRIARRVHVLRAAGMLHEANSETGVFYHYTRRPQSIVLRAEDEPVIALAERWLEHEPQLHISVSSPLYLLQEMFTVRGKGSIIRPGSRIDHVQGTEGVDTKRLLELIDGAFGKKLRDPEGALAAASDIFIESRYRGAVLLEDHPAGKYLSKFTVGTQARGEGVAQELWDTACEPQAALFWRSKSTNPINQWYERHATGLHRNGAWTVFWRGVAPERLPEIIAYSLERPSDFIE
jgi:hypothetical protein